MGFDRTTLQHSQLCQLKSAIRPGLGCSCGANKRIQDALDAGFIQQDEVVETSGGEYEDWDDD